MKPTRLRVVRSVVTVALAAVVASGCASTSDVTGESSAGERGGENSIKLARNPSLTNLPLYVADAEQIWAKHEVTPQYVNIGSAPEAAAAFTSGDLHIANLLGNAIVPIVDQGADLAVVGKNPHNSILDILVRTGYELPADGDWKEVMQALEGSRVGVVAKGSGVEAYARTLFKEAGVDPEAQTYIATGLPSTTLAALSNARIDMTITFEPGLTTGVEEGIATRPFSLMEEDGPRVLHSSGGLMVGPAEYVDDHTDLIGRYMDAYNEAIAFIKDPANREEVLALIEDKLQVSSEMAPIMLENNVDGYPDDVRLSQEDYDILIEMTDYLAEEGAISGRIAPDRWLRTID